MPNSTAPALHIAFGLSAAGSLRRAMAEAERPDKVVGFPDDLSFGPIDSFDPLHRTQWIESELDYDWSSSGFVWSKQIDAFWAEALSLEHRLIVWISRRCAAEFCGFLEWLRRLGEREYEVVDLTDFQVPERLLRDGRVVATSLAVSTAIVTPRQIVDAKLYDLAALQTAAARASYRELWDRLRTENMALRVIADGELMSAPLLFFDEDLLSHATPQWRKAARLVGDVLGRNHERNINPVGDLVLWARVRSLVSAGRLEYRGDLLRIQNTEVRLAAPR